MKKYISPSIKVKAIEPCTLMDASLSHSKSFGFPDDEDANIDYGGNTESGQTYDVDAKRGDVFQDGFKSVWE